MGKGWDKAQRSSTLVLGVDVLQSWMEGSGSGLSLEFEFWA